jgi:membrane associated rhomboid family serine protease
MGAVEPTMVSEGQVWRLLTAAFLHNDLTHIVMNTLSALFFLTRL